MTEPIEVPGLEFFQSPSILKLVPALIRAEMNFDPILKDATNPAFRSKYPTLSSVLKSVMPHLHAEGFLKTDQTGIESDTNIVFVRVIHESGEWLGSRWLLNPAKLDPQGEGSALTYARRYVTCALLGVSADDDDANAATAGIHRPTRQSREIEAAAKAAVVDPPEPSGRKWADEAIFISKQKLIPATRRERLLVLMEECRAFGELDDVLYAHFIELGNALKAETGAVPVPAA
jgi:hypothetical protein